MEKILIVEDSLALSAGLCFELENEKYITVAAYTLKKARELLAVEIFHLVLLDVNLPDGNSHFHIKTIRGMGYVWIGGKVEKKI